ncbi:hypothetical protein PVK06_038338 [Gossypium arboreum]|uniref:Uncharacterized protein n=1 Tax=Gossypium arboreum TaxID=29729 RepID=A0ABR0N0G5_GOSAR|nr:hypothetical protein PVK06_038338 [Gossypium arboreum]
MEEIAFVDIQSEPISDGWSGAERREGYSLMSNFLRVGFDDPSGQESWLVEEKLWPKYGGDSTMDSGDQLKPCLKL